MENTTLTAALEEFISTRVNAIEYIKQQDPTVILVRDQVARLKSELAMVCAQHGMVDELEMLYGLLMNEHYEMCNAIYAQALADAADVPASLRELAKKFTPQIF